MLVHLMSHFALLETVAAPLAIRNSSDLGGRRGVWHQHSSQMELLPKAFCDHARRPPGKCTIAFEEAMHPHHESDWDIFWPGHLRTSMIRYLRAR